MTKSNALPRIPKIEALITDVATRNAQLPVLLAHARNLALAAGVSMSSGIGGGGGGATTSTPTERGVDDNGTIRWDEVAKDLRDIETFLEQAYRNLTWAMQRVRNEKWAKEIAALVPNPPAEQPPVKACRFGCLVRALHGHQLCDRHYKQWDREGRPPLLTWDPGDSELAAVAQGDTPPVSPPLRPQRGRTGQPAQNRKSA